MRCACLRGWAAFTTYCTSLGKAMLSCLEDSEVKQILFKAAVKGLTPQTRYKISICFWPNLRAIRKRGYSIDNEEIEIGLRCVGAPIYDHTDDNGRGDQRRSALRPPHNPETPRLWPDGDGSAAEEISKELGYEKQQRGKAR